MHAIVSACFAGHHISATFELRAGRVKAAARRVERSESLDDVEHSSILMVVMADLARVNAEKFGEKHNDFRSGSLPRSASDNTRAFGVRSQREPASIPARTSGREQPSGPGPGSTPCPNRGVAHAPTDRADCER